MVGNKFQDIILKHSREKIGTGIPERYDSSWEEINTLCGDEIRVYVARHDDSLNISYDMKGCALCAASASIMVEALSEKKALAARSLVERFLRDYPDGPEGELVSDLGPGIEALFDMKRFPARERCVLLPWQALRHCFS